MAAALPPGWRAIIDPESGEPYFANSETGEVTWDDPRLLRQLSNEPSSVRASQGKLLLDTLGSVERSRRNLDPSGSDTDDGESESPKAAEVSRTRRASRSATLLSDSNRREVFSISPLRMSLDSRLIVPSDLAAGYVDINVYRKAKDEWIMLSFFSIKQIARIVRTSTRSLTKGAGFALYVGAQANPTAYCTQSTRSLHPVFHVTLEEGGEPAYTLSRKRGSSELRVYLNKSENVEDCVFVVLVGEDRCLLKVVDMQALGFHLLGTLSDLHLGKFVRIAGGGDAALIFLCYVLIEHVTSRPYVMKWEGEVVAQYERSGKDVSDVAKLMRE